MNLSMLIGNTPTPEECGCEFEMDTQYGMPVISIRELRKGAIKDAVLERFIFTLKQTWIIVYREFGPRDIWHVDGPHAQVVELEKRQNAAMERRAKQEEFMRRMKR